MDVRLPELGEGIESATVVNVLVRPGSELAPGQDIIEIETEKASLPVPTPAAGTVEQVLVKPGDTVKVGQPILRLAEARVTAKAPPSAPKSAEPSGGGQPPEIAKTQGADAPRSPEPRMPAPPTGNGPPVPAGPATRRLARELGVELQAVSGSARGGRVTIDDVKTFVRDRTSRPAAAGGGFVIPPLPDFSKYGPIERQPFSSLRKAIARNLTLAWSAAPAVTQHDTADVTDLEAARKRFTESADKGAPKVTMTALAIRACVAALKAFPQFNSSYDPHAGETGELVLKRYYHIGIAVDTERGLLVPVVRDADKKSMPELARAVAELAEKARAGKLAPDDMKGGSFTITNLGGIGGGYFSPILNYPEVAILGLSRSTLTPVIRNGQVEPRLMLPLSLTYDHRVIDGAAGARFITRLVQLLSEPTRLIFES